MEIKIERCNMAKIMWYEKLKASLVILKKKKKLSIPASRGISLETRN